MKTVIKQKSVHHWIGPGAERVEFDLNFPDYPELPTFGMSLPYPIAKQDIIDAVAAKAQEIKLQIARDAAVRTLFDITILSMDIAV